MTEEQRHELLDLCWRGEKCVICQFVFDQSELEEIVETVVGYAHRSCAKSEEEKESEKNNEKLL